MKKFIEIYTENFLGIIAGYSFTILTAFLKAKSEGKLETDKEYYAFAYFAADFFPFFLALCTTVLLIVYLIMYTGVKIYEYFKK